MTAFLESAERTGAQVVCVADTAAAAEWIQSVAKALPGAPTPPMSAAATRLLGIADPAGKHPPEEPHLLADQPLAITGAEFAIAETGSVVLLEPDRRTALVHMWAHHLVVLVDGSTVIDTLPEAAPRLATASSSGTVTMLSGPSRTADIERRLTIGVQGPQQVTLILIGTAMENR